MKLIGEIRKRREIWDLRDPQKKSKTARKDAIAAVLKTSSSEVEKKMEKFGA